MSNSTYTTDDRSVVTSLAPAVKVDELRVHSALLSVGLWPPATEGRRR